MLLKTENVGGYAEFPHSANSINADLTYSQLDFGFDAAWEIDIWGKVQAASWNIDCFSATLRRSVMRSSIHSCDMTILFKF